MHVFLNRKLRSLICLSFSVMVFLTLFPSYLNGLQSVESVTSNLPTFGGRPLVLSDYGKGWPKDDTTSLTYSTTYFRDRGDVQTGVPASTSQNLMETSAVATPTTLKEEEEVHQSSQSLSASQTHSTLTSNTISATPIPTTPTGAIIAAVSLYTNLSWTSEIENPMWTLHRYNHDDPSPPPNTTFPIDKGNEAMMYLSYVINNYDSLPDYSLFIHGHRLSWHQEGDIVDIINNLRFSALENATYVSLRCDWYPSCPAEIRPVDHDAVVWGPGVQRENTEYEIGKAWQKFFGNETLPRTISSQCCAQFVVTRKAIHRRPRKEYERMREWLVQTELTNDVSGRVFEKLWAYIFTKEAVRCPRPQQCACEYFGQCGYKWWPVPPQGWPQASRGLVVGR